MTIGIYCINFDGISEYVGQSDNIERRTQDHLRKLLVGTHYNLKLLKNYNSFGNAKTHILEVCTSKDLNDREVYWINKLDTYNNGCNNTKGGETFGYGETSSRSKYTNKQIITVLHLLLNIRLSTKDISEVTSVPRGTVEGIASFRTHVWLSKECPVEYEELKRIQKLRLRYTKHIGDYAISGITYPEILSPTGEIFKIINAASFAREHSLDPSYFRKVLNKKAVSCKGWRLPEKYNVIDKRKLE